MRVLLGPRTLDGKRRESVIQHHARWKISLVQPRLEESWGDYLFGFGFLLLRWFPYSLITARTVLTEMVDFVFSLAPYTFNGLRRHGSKSFFDDCLPHEMKYSVPDFEVLKSFQSE